MISDPLPVGHHAGVGSMRPARLHDIPVLLAIVRAAYRAEGGHRGWTTEADIVEGPRTSEPDLHARLTASDHLILVAEAYGTPVGCCELARLHDGAVEFGMFAVHPRWQGLGHGGAILRQAEGIAAKLWQARQMRMLVIEERSELIAWYRRRGYRLLAGTVPFHAIAPSTDRPRHGGVVFVTLYKSLEAA